MRNKTSVPHPLSRSRCVCLPFQGGFHNRSRKVPYRLRQHWMRPIYDGYTRLGFGAIHRIVDSGVRGVRPRHDQRTHGAFVRRRSGFPRRLLVVREFAPMMPSPRTVNRRTLSSNPAVRAASHITVVRTNESHTDVLAPTAPNRGNAPSQPLASPWCQPPDLK